MATAGAKGPSKTDFVRQLLKKDPTANRKVVEEAWLSAGHEGPISSSLVSNLRSELGLTGDKRGGSKPAVDNGATATVKTRTRRPKKRGRRARAKASGTPVESVAERKPRSGGQDKAIADIEGDIDRLIFKLMVAGGMEKVEEELRKVRRLLYRGSPA
jgi:hypothetical protein